ncbi:MAG: AP protein [Alphaproteobacteria bacterium]|nr:AP protein [Alphaproteobacteria bacterium]
MRSPASFAAIFLTCSLLPVAQAQQDSIRTRNVVIITDDGLRWEEVFRGADSKLIDKQAGGVEDPEALQRAFGGDTPEQRREKLMPFFWTTVARKGIVLGNRDRNSPVRATNGKYLSYAGYNEMLTGNADPRIDFNDKRPNPNVTVLEWLSQRDSQKFRVSAVAGWDVMPSILNTARSGIPVNAGWQPIGGPELSTDAILLNRMMELAIRDWETVRNDVFTFWVAMEQLPRTRPNVLLISLGDTDDYAHGGRYDQYLKAAHQFDAHLKELWETLQAHPQYRDSTTVIITTDHGRGHSAPGWRDHDAKTPGSEEIWIAVMGPDTPPLGERTDTREVTQGQIASTVAALMGELNPFRIAFPKAAPPIEEASGK